MDKIEKQYHEIKNRFFKEIIGLLNETEANISDFLFEEAMQKSAPSSGYYKLLFPFGQLSVVHELEIFLTDQAINQCLENDQDIKSIRIKIQKALEAQIIDSMGQKARMKIFNYLAKIDNAAEGLKIASKICDNIWRYAGDKSTDLNYYTKRGLLITVYLQTQIFYQTDQSVNHEASRKFIKNALDNIINIAKVKNKFTLPRKEDVPFLRLFL
ncbi:MAG: hypothetical protein DGJ47_000472 [Rickettsiaceae bacterium]